MKKIINGRKYDTETAKYLGGWCNGLSCSDFSYCSEDLYRKKNGEFFLYGDGGAQSRYSKMYEDGSIGGGYGIIPLTLERAKRWAESKLTCDKYEEIFGEVDE